MCVTIFNNMHPKVFTFVIVLVADRIFGAEDEGFSLSYHVEATSAVVAYCLAMVITFATVGFSAYRVSRMNIIEAVRDLPESPNPDDSQPFFVRLLGVWFSFFRPAIYLYRSARHLISTQFVNGFLIILKMILMLNLLVIRLGQ